MPNNKKTKTTKIKLFAKYSEQSFKVSDWVFPKVLQNDNYLL